MPQFRNSPTRLTVQNTYPCPVCRCGKISTLPLMDAMGCRFCQHIFTVDWERQVLKLADSQPALTWFWQGKRWKGIYSAGTRVGWGYLAIAIAFVILPTILVGTAAYIFPPIPGAALSWFPILWTVLAFLSHLAGVLWIAIEYYQLPISLYLRAIGQAIARRRWNGLRI